LIPDITSQSSILAAVPDKHTKLKKIVTDKIIVLGGSNVSFGMDSKKLEEKFHKPIVNMGIHAGVGLEYIINDIKPYVKKGDILILMPEYEHFYTDNFYGEIELVSVIFDIEPSSKKLVNAKQWLHLLKYLPTYSAKKIKNYLPTLLHKKNQAVDIYHRNSFNEYGDAYLHWSLPNQNYLPAPKNNGKEKVNPEVIHFLRDFNLYVKQQGAQLYFFPPVIDQTSFEHQKIIITKIAEDLKNNDIAFISEPKKYCYDNKLFFNSYYHLNKTGVDKRTQQLITDLDSLKSE
jgi:hypothetical protein